MRLRSIPKSATTIATLSGIVNVPEERGNNGKVANVSFLAAYVSDGYKSEYQAHQAYYIVVRVEGAKPYAKRYSGSNLEKAKEHWADIAKCLAPLPGVQS